MNECLKMQQSVCQRVSVQKILIVIIHGIVVAIYGRVGEVGGLSCSNRCLIDLTMYFSQRGQSLPIAVTFLGSINL
jgi:hypothetical protein